MTGWRSRCVGALFAVVGGLCATPLAACTCVEGWPTLAETAVDEETSLVLVVRLEQLESVSSTASGPRSGFDYIDGEVLEVLKGELSRPRIRIWDVAARTSCGGGLDRYRPGTVMVFSGRFKTAAQDEYFGVLGLAVPDGDVLSGGGCHDAWKAVADASEAWAVTGLKAKGR
jgi:hypothetical protein